MFIKDQHYILAIKSGFMIQEKAYCIWNGEDFYPLKAVLITDPHIPVNEPLNNRVEILSIRKMS